MKADHSLKPIPYGKSDFTEFKKRNLYFVDKTRYIQNIEEKGYFLFFIRPRRFGKSLFLSIMENYYDIALKDQFDDLFSGTDIHKEPTPERNQYMVLKFNFARIDPIPEKVEEAFLKHIKTTCISFINKYEKYLNLDIEEIKTEFNSTTSSSVIMDTLLNYCLGKEQKLYVIIDEYDNFANTILTSSGHQSYHDVTHGEGFLRSFFNV
ncbi:MAG: AAA family ATPase, partial [Candidatus Omnitrophota bacterium]